MIRIRRKKSYLPSLTHKRRCPIHHHPLRYATYRELVGYGNEVRFILLGRCPHSKGCDYEYRVLDEVAGIHDTKRMGSVISKINHITSYNFRMRA